MVLHLQTLILKLENPWSKLGVPHHLPEILYLSSHPPQRMFLSMCPSGDGPTVSCLHQNNPGDDRTQPQGNFEIHFLGSIQQPYNRPG